MGRPVEKELIILSNRARDRSPAMCCVVELEDSLKDQFEAEMIFLPNIPKGPLSNKIVYFAALHFGQVDLLAKMFAKMRCRGATVIVHVFDTWNASEFYHARRRRLKESFASYFKITNFCDRMLIPFREDIGQFDPKVKRQLVHVPFGIDSSLTDGFNDYRPINVLGYGRQPDEIIHILSQRLNQPSSRTMFYHTGHMQISGISDYTMHRRHFWRVAESSAVALAFDPQRSHPRRFPHSIVGQRWFESLAAGCVIAGWRPTTPEADELLNWQHATIEVSHDPKEAVNHILDLTRDTRFLTEIRERNVTEVRAKHDWRHRSQIMFSNL
jgi:hypothetical protein